MSLNPQQFTQLPMFMTAQELRHGMLHADVNPGARQATQDAVWDRKLAESQISDPSGYGSHAGPGRADVSLADAVRADGGVREPVKIMHGGTGRLGDRYLKDGHHRVAVAYAAGGDTLVPVQHLDHINDSYVHRGKILPPRRP